MIRICVLAIGLLCLAGCGGQAEEDTISASVSVDGEAQSYTYSVAVSVEELLAGAQIVLGEHDRVSHPLSLLIADGMHVTVRRVREEQVCLRETLAYDRKLIAYEGIPAGQEEIGRAGQTGLQEACYRAILEDGVETGRTLIGQPTILAEPQDEIRYVGPAETVEPMAIVGRISYINNGTAWTIEGNTREKRALIHASGLDSLVFAQNGDGSLLLYTAAAEGSEQFFNGLWMLSFDGEARPVKLAPTDVLYAEWRPRSGNVIAYSTGEVGAGPGPWKALNNLWIMQIERRTGRALLIDEIIRENGGGDYGWWGTHYGWSPHGDRMAWVNAEGAGLVDIDGKRLVRLLDYAPFKTSGGWVWLSQLSWSHDGSLIAVTAHGAALGNEPPQTSPVFDLAVLEAGGRFKAVLRDAVGMWAGPSFSGEAGREEGYLAWLQARDPFNSIKAEHDLILADRDGSNQRVIFPPAGSPGILSSDYGLTPKDMAWSPDARHIAIVYLGDLWLVEAATGRGHQISFDGGASNPVWTD